jgi:hypothetical protein
MADTKLSALPAASSIALTDLVYGDIGSASKSFTPANMRDCLITRGTATLVAGTKTVSTAAIGATSFVALTVRTLGTVTVPNALQVKNVVNGVSFDILSADGSDTSVIAWAIF